MPHSSVAMTEPWEAASGIAHHGRGRRKGGPARPPFGVTVLAVHQLQHLLDLALAGLLYALAELLGLGVLAACGLDLRHLHGLVLVGQEEVEERRVELRRL